MKISFDFDGTLADGKIQDLAKSLVDAGHDVWILTARWDDYARDENGNRIFGHYGYNMDLRQIAKRVGIPEDKILFTNGALKEKMYFDHKFEMHYDDLIEEVNAINNKGGCAMLVYSSYMEIRDQIQFFDLDSE